MALNYLSKKSVNLAVLAIFAAVLAITGFYFSKGAFEGIEARVIDSNFKRRGAVGTNKKILIVGFTDSCMGVIGKWPWKRSVHATVIEKLAKAGARAVAVDVLFQDKSVNGGDDEALARVMGENKKIVLSAVMSPKTIYQDGTLINTRQSVMPIPDFASQAAGIGFISVNYDALNPDGILRSVALADVDENGKKIDSFATVTARVAGFTGFEALAGAKYYVNYHGPAKTYEYLTFSKIFSGELEMSYFKDKIVLVGPLATALGDLHHTPYGTMPGTEVQANILDCILSHSFLKRLPGWGVMVLCAGLMAICYGALVWRGLFYFTAACFLSLAFAISANVFMFSCAGLIIDAVPVAAALLSCYFISALFYSYAGLLMANFQLNKKVRELNALYSISKNISELINLDKILKDVLDEAIGTIGTQRGSLMLIDEDEQKLEVKVTAGIDRPLEKKVLIPIGEGIAGKVFSEGAPIVSNDITRDERFKDFAEYGDKEGGDKVSKVRSILCVPLLISEKKTIGVINIVNKTDNTAFSGDDVKLMETIAHHAATLIENSKLYKLATVDGMTGLYVHRYFQVRFKEEFSRATRYNKNISALMTDIDHFKKFNDTYGHQCGDMVLSHVARIVRETIRNIDIAARYGGEEFAVALPETDAEGAYKLAERIRKNVEESYCSTPKGDLKVTISLGVASNLNTKSPTHLALIACADSALYKSKEGGRNRVTVFSGERLPASEKKDE